jgi:XTP/dITP diphosphohydrolase
MKDNKDLTNSEIVFATNNQHKLTEIRAILEGTFTVLGLSELDLNVEIPEDHETLEENASQKAWFIHDRTGKNCFADDTGLEVYALDGDPGVYSARYSRMGEPVFPEMEVAEGNIRKLLLKMTGKEDRRARFRTVIALVLDGKEHQFEGVVDGRISTQASGKEGFGYDPVFIPEGYDQSFAEMALPEKNKISHRALAVQALAQFLRNM